MAYIPQPNPNPFVAEDRFAQRPPPYPSQAYPPHGPNCGGSAPPGASPAPMNYGGPPPQPQMMYAQPPPSHPGGSGQPAPMAHDPEAPFKSDPTNWSERIVRHAFVQKVYMLVLVMLAVAIGLSALFMYTPAIRDYVRQNKWIYWVSWVVGFGLMIYMACSETARRKTPNNYILLCIFTLAMSFMVATVCTWHNTEEVLFAMGITMGVVIAVTVFACQTKYDFTGWAVYLWGITWALLIFGIFAIIFRSRVVSIVYAAIGAVVFSIYLIVDTQMIMGGKRFELSPEEYVFGAITIFIDIINIFVLILSVIGGVNN